MTLTRVTPPDALRTMPESASTVANGIRAVGESVSDSQEAMASRGAPAGWKGSASDAAENQFTQISGDLDSAVAALGQAATAMDAFDDTLQKLFSRRETLVEEVSAFNRKVDAYDADVAASDQEDAEAQEALKARYAELESQVAALQGRVDSWNADQDAADAAVIRALQAVDTVAEGDKAAADPDRPDAAALADRLQDKVDAGDPEAVAAWWATLSEAQKQALMIHSPELVGNAGGIPSADRDEANRTSMLSDIDNLTEREKDGQLTDREEDRLENARDAQKTLDGYKDRINPDTGENDAFLLIFRPDAFEGDGGVAMSLGNPDTADDVTSFVPGLTSEATSLGGNMDSMERLMQLADEKNGDRSVAAITWIDYDAPSSADGMTDNPLDFLQVATQDKATDGGERFADFVTGLRASDQGSQAHFTAIGHSYGSTTVSHAATDQVLPVDDMVLIGSPGTGSADHATDLMADGNVYVGSADYDPVTLLGGPGLGALGHDPSQADFGAHRFEVDPGSYRVQDLLDNHSSYFNQDSTSLDAMADVVAGARPDEVDGRTLGSYQTLDTLATGSSLVSGGEKVWEGAEWTGDKISDGAGWAWDRAEDAGSWLNPLD
ncbi:alpha/beta hydrolase [Aeromicrobium sp. NPDC092404]|uniref:alpha/beta hydrolase n=1 Tax=Aeromicrobium sp. NPDC092404 TaxID=3154976 RepID=UPI0034495368